MALAEAVEHQVHVSPVVRVPRFHPEPFMTTI